MISIKRIYGITLIFYLVCLALPLLGQDSSATIVVAAKYFNTISKNYAGFSDYQASVSISQSGSTMVGELKYRAPHSIRIDFSQPKEQVIVANAGELQVYIPSHRVVMKQNLSDSPASMGTAAGLRLMAENYAIAYVSEKYLPLDEENPGSLRVRKLRLSRTNSREGFLEIILSITENGYIRRMDGKTISGANVRMDFTNMRIDQGIPSSVFDYIPPPTANSIENFLFEAES